MRIVLYHWHQKWRYYFRNGLETALSHITNITSAAGFNVKVEDLI